MIFIDSYNEAIGDMHLSDGIHCDICKNKGWVMYNKDGYDTMRQCSCMARRQSVKAAKESGLGTYLTKDISDYIVSEPWQKKCYESMQNYISDHSADNVWFMALGQSGCGKTLICSIISNYLLLVAKRRVRYITWTDFIGQVKRDMMGDKTNDVSEYLDKLKNVEVLFIDELLKKYNETDLRYLIEIINYRYTNDLKTIITSEHIIDKLLDIDEATFSRVIEKCEGFSINIPKDRKKNWRLRSLNL